MSQVPPWRRIGVARGSQLFEVSYNRDSPEAGSLQGESDRLARCADGLRRTYQPAGAEPGSDYTSRHQEHYRSRPSQRLEPRPHSMSLEVMIEGADHSILDRERGHRSVLELRHNRGDYGIVYPVFGIRHNLVILPQTAAQSFARPQHPHAQGGSSVRR